MGPIPNISINYVLVKLIKIWCGNKSPQLFDHGIYFLIKLSKLHQLPSSPSLNILLIQFEWLVVVKRSIGSSKASTQEVAWFPGWNSFHADPGIKAESRSQSAFSVERTRIAYKEEAVKYSYFCAYYFPSISQCWKTDLVWAIRVLGHAASKKKMNIFVKIFIPYLPFPHDWIRVDKSTYLSGGVSCHHSQKCRPLCDDITQKILC